MQYLIEKIDKIEKELAGSKFAEETLVLDLLEIIKGMSAELESLKKSNEELESYINTIDEDLGNIEALVLEEVEEEDYEELSDEDFQEIQCDSCKETIYIDKEIYKERKEFTCPNCQNIIRFK